MDISFPYNVMLQFPGDLEYIPAIRKFISEILITSNFSPKFAYRSEIIVDELCSNAVNFGCRTEDAQIELICNILDDRIEFTIKDQGGLKENIDKLQSTLNKSLNVDAETNKHGLGLEIVRLLSEKFDVTVDSQNLTSVHVVRNREDTAAGL